MTQRSQCKFLDLETLAVLGACCSLRCCRRRCLGCREPPRSLDACLSHATAARAPRPARSPLSPPLFSGRRPPTHAIHPVIAAPARRSANAPTEHQRRGAGRLTADPLVPQVLE